MTAFVYNIGSDGSGGWPQPGGGAIAHPLSALGLVEFGGIRVHDGTFVLTAAGGLTDTPDVRTDVTDRARAHGAFLSGSFYGPRVLTVEGYVMTDHLDQMWPAIDLLRKACSLPAGEALLRVEALMPGWSGRRFTLARPVSPVAIANQSGSDTRKPYRDWQVALLAPDPRLYGLVVLDPIGLDFGATLTAAGSSTKRQENDGTYPAPGVWIVDGPAEKPELIDDGRGLAIRYGGPVATGSTLRVDTLERTATLDGANAYRNLTRFDDLSVPPGGADYRGVSQATNTGGTWRYEHRHTWI